MSCKTLNSGNCASILSQDNIIFCSLMFWNIFGCVRLLFMTLKLSMIWSSSWDLCTYKMFWAQLSCNTTGLALNILVLGTDICFPTKN
jgi:hypothetical protein